MKDVKKEKTSMIERYKNRIPKKKRAWLNVIITVYQRKRNAENKQKKGKKGKKINGWKKTAKKEQNENKKVRGRRKKGKKQKQIRKKQRKVKAGDTEVPVCNFVTGKG
jgi:hypothetical protein